MKDDLHHVGLKIRHDPPVPADPNAPWPGPAPEPAPPSPKMPHNG